VPFGGFGALAGAAAGPILALVAGEPCLALGACAPPGSASPAVGCSLRVPAGLAAPAALAPAEAASGGAAGLAGAAGPGSATSNQMELSGLSESLAGVGAGRDGAAPAARACWPGVLPGGAAAERSRPGAPAGC
jgi:hypothetical protein